MPLFKKLKVIWRNMQTILSIQATPCVTGFTLPRTTSTSYMASTSNAQWYQPTAPVQ